jgi:Tol biopolymer transport system component
MAVFHATFCTACAAPLLGGERCAACGAPIRAPAEVAVAARSPKGGRSRPAWTRRVVTLLPPVLALAIVLSGLVRYQAEQTRAAERYAAAEAAEAAGHYSAAAELFAAAGDYRDAEQRRAAALATYRTIYLDAAAALDAGRYDEAVALLLPLARRFPGESDATLLLAQARAAWEGSLRQRADEAARAGDWLGAERALAELAAASGDPAVADELTALQREHSPLVLARDDGIYLVGPTGADERLITNAVPATQPAWSPDRSRIAFTSPYPTEREAADLWVVNVDGTGLWKVAERVASYRWALWSPDGTRLAYASFAQFDTSTSRGTIGVRVVDLATRVETDLTSGRWAYAASPTWAPDGNRLAFVTRVVVSPPELSLELGAAEVLELDLTTGTSRSLTGNRLPDAWRVAWNPRSDHLLVSTRVWNDGFSRPEDLYLLDAASGALSAIEDGPALVSGAVWSPDGSRYAYVDLDRAIVRVGTPGKPEGWVRLLHPTSDVLTWSPDGRALLAASPDPWAPSLLLRLDGLGPPQAPVELAFTTDWAAAAPPQWSPRNPTPPAAAPTTGGTAHDPARPIASGPVPDLTSHRRPFAPQPALEGSVGPA